LLIIILLQEHLLFKCSCSGDIYPLYNSSLYSANNMSKILGIDHGSVRLGIAVSDPSASIAFGREVIANNKKALPGILALIKDEEITKVIVGYPLNLKGEKTQQTLEVDKFIVELKLSFSLASMQDVTVEMWDERFTSKLAADSMLSSGMKKKQRQVKGNIDIISAALMLQSYLDSKKNSF
jgi:putative Holliday junction resolvase